MVNEVDWKHSTIRTENIVRGDNSHTVARVVSTKRQAGGNVACYLHKQSILLSKIINVNVRGELRERVSRNARCCFLIHVVA